MRYLPAAIAGEPGTRQLNLYRNRDCSSLLEANPGFGTAFARGEYFELDDTVAVDTTTLELALAKHGVDNVDYALDIQGAELEALKGAPRIVEDQLLAIRLEVNFAPLYEGQPSPGEIDAHLRAAGFVPMEFLELHSWRRTTRAKLPRLDPGPLPYSRGQLAHGDVLYFRDPDAIPGIGVERGERTVRAALIALAFEHVDHADYLLALPDAAAVLAEGGVQAQALVREVSQSLARRSVRDRPRSLRSRLWRRLRD